jgi:uncharacterized protein (TIGR02594 family)
VSEPVWMVEARKWLGVHERRHHSKLWAGIKQWVSEKFDPRQTPWCGAFVDLVISKTLPNEKLPENTWGARNWLTFGTSCTLQTGAIAVFWRGKKSGWSGHVGFIDAIDHKNRRIRVLGGNQSDAVTLAWLSMDRLLDVRWPKTAPKGTGAVKTASSKGAKVSTNEE